MELYLEIITKILIAMALFLAALVWGFIKEWLKDTVVRNIVADGIRYAQKVYGHLDGDTRYDNALEKIVLRLQHVFELFSFTQWVKNEFQRNPYVLLL